MKGFFNIDLLKYSSHAKTNDYVDNIFTRGFVPLITKPTRIFPSSATLIDHIYSNNIQSYSQSGIIVTDVADHFGIFHTVRNKTKHLQNLQRKSRIFSDTNLALFKQYLDQSDFSSILTIDNPNNAYETFIDLYKQAYEKSFPLKIIKPNKKYIKKEPWITTGLLTSMRHKNKLFKKKFEHPTYMHISKYKQYNNLKRIMKIKYYSNFLEYNKHNMKKTWEFLQKAIGKQHNKSNFPQTFKIENDQITDQVKIAESFNKYFSSIGIKTSENVPKANKHYSEYLTNPITNSMFLEPVEPSHIFEIVNKLKPKTSCGHDQISSKMIKDTIKNIAIPLSHIINRSLSTGIVPNQLKIAKVIPVYKTSNKDDIKNYRPISLLPAFSKIFEKVMFTKIMSFLNSQKILYKINMDLDQNIQQFIHLFIY